jgi:hypothetical protein
MHTVGYDGWQVRARVEVRVGGRRLVVVVRGRVVAGAGGGAAWVGGGGGAAVGKLVAGPVVAVATAGSCGCGLSGDSTPSATVPHTHNVNTPTTGSSTFMVVDIRGFADATSAGSPYRGWV